MAKEGKEKDRLQAEEEAKRLEEEELEKQRLSCNSPESCTKLFEFNPTSERLIDQILHTLVTNHPGDNLSFATS